MDAQSRIEWLLSLQKILGELGVLDRRLQADSESVTNAELLEAAAKVEKLNPASAGAQSGPYDLFYRKYSALLHPYLEARGLGRGSPAPPVWDSGKAMNEMVSHFNDSESQLETVTFAHDLMRAVQQLEAGGNVSNVEAQRLLDGMDEYADRVIDLAPKHPKLPAQFADLRERLYQAVRRRASGSGR